MRGHPTSPWSSEAKGSSSSSATLHNVQRLPLLLGLFGQIQTDPTPGTRRHPPAEVGREVWRWPGRYVLPVPGQGGRCRAPRVPGDRSFVWLVERDKGKLCRNRFILLNPRGSSASDMVSRDSAEAKESLA